MINYEVSQHLHGGQVPGQLTTGASFRPLGGDDIKSPNCSNIWRLVRVDGKIFMKNEREYPKTEGLPQGSWIYS